MRTYQIHDNGGVPFEVDVLNNHVRIRRLEDNKTIEYDVEKVFIGKSPRNKMTEFSGGFGDEFDGNTILLRLKDNEYIHISDEVCKYSIEKDIMMFVSPVGNNDVPYPYALDSTGFIYLFPEQVVIHKLSTDTSLERKRDYKRIIDEYDDPYQYYYGMSEDDSISLYIHGGEWENDDPYWFRYNQDPENDFNRLTEDGKHKMSITKDGITVFLSKKDYCEINENYSKELGFSYLPITEVIMSSDD